MWASETNLAAARKSPSMVVLPDLPKPVRKVLEHHDQKILETFTGYALACSAQLAMEVGQATALPLSKTAYPQHSDPSIVRTCLEQTAIHVVARSPFVANSGHPDRFNSVEELVQSTRNDLHLNNNSIPSMKHLMSKGGHLLNAYLLDFYMHGQVSTLAKANGIRRGDIWYLLQDFEMSLRTIQVALKKLLMEVPGNAEASDSEFHDPAEMEEDELEGDRASESEGDMQRPAEVTERDWKLYSIVSDALREFDEKFRAMWA